METREALSIRFPPDLLREARRLKAHREPLNDLVVAAVERKVRRRQGLQAFDAVSRLRESVRRSTGPQPDSGRLIRSLREDAGR
jgi:hypothetical protein